MIHIVLMGLENERIQNLKTKFLEDALLYKQKYEEIWNARDSTLGDLERVC